MTINYTLFNKKQKKFNFEKIGNLHLFNTSTKENIFSPNEKTLKIGFLTDFMPNIVENVVKTVLSEIDISFEIINLAQEAIELQIMDTNSELYVNFVDVIFIYPDYNKMLNELIKNNLEISSISSTISNHWSNFWNLLNLNSNCIVIQHDCPMDLMNNFNNQLIQLVNEELLINCPTNVHWVEISKISKEIDQWVDDKYLDSTRMPFSPKNTMAYFGEMNKVLRSIFRKPIKMIISDLDGVMWDGILADDGPELIATKIDLNSDTKSAGIANILFELMQEGYLIAISSKNYLYDFRAVLNISKKFRFNFEDFVSIECSWEPKPIGISKILHKVGFSPENVIFIDDSRIECAEVKNQFPTMIVLNIDNQSLTTRLHFQQLGFFNNKEITTEDINRNVSYKVIRKLNEMENELTRLDFLSSLKMRIEINPYSKKDSVRIQQMFERTNQFRANTKNWEASSVKSQSKTFKLELRDKYADYGIVSIMIFHVSGEELVIDNWLMSCRVFGRNLEREFLERIVALCVDKKLQCIRICYEQTKRNAFFSQILENLGFSLIEGSFCIEIDNF